MPASPNESRRFAKSLRTHQTFPEKILWGRLRAHRAGPKFRRRFVIGPYIADFCCPDQRLIVEIDGRSHHGRHGHDLTRQSWLESQSWRVIRFSNDAVLHSLDTVVARIVGECSTQRETPKGESNNSPGAAPAPSPNCKSPSPLVGEGGSAFPQRER